MPERILVVDDDQGMRDTLRLLLELDGYNVVTAPDGHVGLQRLKEAATAVVVLDVMMPHLDGFGFAAEAVRRGLREGTAILILTADGRAQEKAARAGADDWLEKPFDLQELLDKVARLLVARKHDEASKPGRTEGP